MKKIIKLSALICLLCYVAACSSLNQSSSDVHQELAALKSEVIELKNRQIEIAQRVGLGALVRPEKIFWEEGKALGSDTAPIVMIEFTDLQCPFCKRFHEEIWPDLKKEYVDTGIVQFVGKELPLVKIHKSAGFGAVALRCASEQDQYAKAKDALFNVGAGINQQFVQSLPELLGIDKDIFDVCMNNVSQHNAVKASVKMAQDLGVGSTPTFILGLREGESVTDYEFITGASSLEAFRAQIQRLLAK